MDGLAKDLSTVLDLGNPSPIAIAAALCKKYQRPVRRKKRGGTSGSEKRNINDSESHAGSATSSGDNDAATTGTAGAIASGSCSSSHQSYSDMCSLSTLHTPPRVGQVPHTAAVVAATSSCSLPPTAVVAAGTGCDMRPRPPQVSVIESDSFNENFGPVVAVQLCGGRGVSGDKNKRLAVDTSLQIAAGASLHQTYCRRKKRRLRDKTSGSSAHCMEVSCSAPAADYLQPPQQQASYRTRLSTATLPTILSCSNITATPHAPLHSQLIDCDDCRRSRSCCTNQAIAAAAIGVGKRKRTKKRRSHCHHSSSVAAGCAGNSLGGMGDGSSCHMEISHTDCSSGANTTGTATTAAALHSIADVNGEVGMDTDMSAYGCGVGTSSVSEYDTDHDPGADTTDEARDGDDEGSDEQEVDDTYGIPMIPWWKLSINHHLSLDAAAAAAGGDTTYCLGVPTVTREILAGKRRLNSGAKPHFHQLNEKIKRFLNDAVKQELWLESTRKEERDHVRLLARLYCIGIRYEGSLKNICVLTKTRSTKLNVKEILQ